MGSLVYLYSIRLAVNPQNLHTSHGAHRTIGLLLYSLHIFPDRLTFPSNLCRRASCVISLQQSPLKCGPIASLGNMQLQRWLG